MVARIPTIVHNGTTVLNNPNYELMPKTPTYDTISGNVVGFGTYVVNQGMGLNFLYGVSSGQTVKITGGATTPTGITIGADFHGHVEMDYTQPYSNAPLGSENLGISIAVGEAHLVDSYSFKNDMLKLWSGNKLIESLSLTVHDPYGITVQRTYPGWVEVSANDRSHRGIDINYHGGNGVIVGVHHT